MKRMVFCSIIILTVLIYTCGAYAVLDPDMGIFYNTVAENATVVVFTFGASGRNVGYLQDININMSKNGGPPYEILVYKNSDIVASLGAKPGESKSVSLSQPVLYCPGDRLKVKHVPIGTGNSQNAKVTTAVRLSTTIPSICP